MQWIQIIPIIFFFFDESIAVRLNKLFQFVDGFQSEHSLRGFLHVGNEYAIFLHTPKPHDKYLVYELYEVKNQEETGTYKPRMLAIAKVPVEYVKEQLRIFRSELYKAKYVDKSVVPGTEVKTLREWQIDRALEFHDNAGQLNDKVPVLRTII